MPCTHSLSEWLVPMSAPPPRLHRRHEGVAASVSAGPSAAGIVTSPLASVPDAAWPLALVAAAAAAAMVAQGWQVKVEEEEEEEEVESSASIR